MGPSSLPSCVRAFSIFLHGSPYLIRVAHVSMDGGRINWSMDTSPEAMPLRVMIPAPAAIIHFLCLLREEWGLMRKAPQYS